MFFKEAPEMLSYYYSEPKADPELMANAKQKVTADILPAILDLLLKTLESVPETQWTNDGLQHLLFDTAEKNDLKKGQLLWPLRAALTGLPFSPGAFEVAAALGKEKTLARLVKAQSAVG
jgi:glutamyl-tRNA synthetase